MSLKFSPEQLAADLPSEWEQRTGFARTPAHEPIWNQALTKLNALCELMGETADINVDTDDLRAALFPYTSIRIGSAVASGTGRAQQLVQAALDDAHSWVLGSEPTTAATHILLCIESHTSAELEMDELTAITEHIQQTVGDDRATVVFGHDLLPNLPSELQLHLLLSYGPLLTPLPKWPSTDRSPTSIELNDNILYGHGLLADKLLSEWEVAQRPTISYEYILARRPFARELYQLLLYPYGAEWEPLPEAAIRATMLAATQLYIGEGIALSLQRATQAMRLAIANCAKYKLPAGPANIITGLIIQISTSPEIPATSSEVADALSFLQTELHATAITPIVGIYPSKKLPANGFCIRLLLCAGNNTSISPEHLQHALQKTVYLDTLLIEATHLLRSHKRINNIFFNTHLGIGYNLSFQLLENLKDNGAIKLLEDNWYVATEDIIP